MRYAEKASNVQCQGARVQCMRYRTFPSQTGQNATQRQAPVKVLMCSCQQSVFSSPDQFQTSARTRLLAVTSDISFHKIMCVTDAIIVQLAFISVMLGFELVSYDAVSKRSRVRGYSAQVLNLRHIESMESLRSVLIHRCESS